MNPEKRGYSSACSSRLPATPSSVPAAPRMETTARYCTTTNLPGAPSAFITATVSRFSRRNAVSAL